MAKKNTNLDALWDSLIDAMKVKLKSDEVTAADLNVVRQLLKDNGVSANMRDPEDAKKVNDLVSRLPMDDPDEIQSTYQ